MNSTVPGVEPEHYHITRREITRLISELLLAKNSRSQDPLFVVLIFTLGKDL